MKLFFLGVPSDAYAVTYLDPDPQQKRVRIGGSFYASAAVYSRYKIVEESGGISRLVIYSCLPSAWNRNGVFNIEVDLDGLEAELDVNGATVKPDGTVIDRVANELFEAVNPYIGDMPANGKIAELLGISRELGSFQNELQTSEAPYAWILHFENRPSSPASFEEKMRGYACVLMAAVDNLGEVRWDYPAEFGSGAAKAEEITKEGERMEGKMTEEIAGGEMMEGETEGRGMTQGSMTKDECSTYVGGDIKAFSESPEKIQELLQRIGFLP